MIALDTLRDYASATSSLNWKPYRSVNNGLVWLVPNDYDKRHSPDTTVALCTSEEDCRYIAAACPQNIREILDLIDHLQLTAQMTLDNKGNPREALEYIAGLIAQRKETP